MKRAETLDGREVIAVVEGSSTWKLVDESGTQWAEQKFSDHDVDVLLTIIPRVVSISVEYVADLAARLALDAPLTEERIRSALRPS